MRSATETLEIFEGSGNQVDFAQRAAWLADGIFVRTLVQFAAPPASLFERRIPMRQESPGTRGQRSSERASTGVISTMQLRNLSSAATRCAGSALGFACLVVLALLCACSGHQPTGDSQPDEPIQECDLFLASYEQCLGTLGPASVARARVEQTRAAFASTHGTAPRAALRQKCIDNLTQLKTTCR